MVSTSFWLIDQSPHPLPKKVIDFKSSVDGTVNRELWTINGEVNSGGRVERIGIVLLQREVRNYLGLLALFPAVGGEQAITEILDPP